MEIMREEGFRRDLKTRHLQLIALGGIIGSGYFLGSGYVIDTAGPAAFLAYILGGLIILCVMLCLGELAVSIPISGSFVTYANDFISPTWACGVGWSYWLTWVTYIPSEMIAAGIIMHNFFPQISTLTWALLFGLLITIINLTYVGTFGEVEFWLALIKIIAIIMFCILAIIVIFGLAGTDEPLGSSILLKDGTLFPKGIWAVLLTMVIILVNFQGSEIIGLAAGESQAPEKTIPRAIMQVTTRIVALYVIPMFLLVTIMPWDEASLEESVFAAALSKYGFEWAGALFSFVVLTAALSCSNSGLYGTSRALYAIAREGMAPKLLAKLNKRGVPQNAVIATLAGCWLGIIAYTIDTSETVYTYLLALSGFTGIIAWISICWSQINFRRRLTQLGIPVEKLKFKVPLYPLVPHLGIWLQVAAMIIMLFNEDLRISFYIGVPLLILPMLWYHFWGRRFAKKEENRTKFEHIFTSNS